MALPVPLLPRWLRWVGVAGLAVFIFYTSIVTVPPETVVDAGKPALLPLDKWRHFVAYAVLGFALAYATTDWEWDSRLLAVAVIGAVVLYGVGIEAGQSLVPERYFSLGDAYANALGGVLVAPYFLVRQYLRFLTPKSFLSAVLGRD
jgi:VanZ family protein